MDHSHTEQQFQSLNICHRLYNFLKFLAHKKVICGHLVPRRLAQAPPVPNDGSSRSSQVVHPMAQGTPPNDQEGREKIASNTTAAAADSASNSEEKNGLESEDEAAAAAADSASNSEGKKGVELEEEAAAAIGSSASQPKSAPKKMVSINENVETIRTSKKKKSKKNKNKEKEILDDSIPLKSILKVSSDVNNTLDNPSLLSLANGA